jgi:methylenetetrahydrofolate reductase (NADPH)
MHDVMHVDNKADFFVLSSGLSEKHLESPLLSDLKG